MPKQEMTLRIDDTMEDVLDVLTRWGFATTGMLVDETGYSRPTVTKRLDRLHAAEKIEYVHESTALWRLIEDPREGHGTVCLRVPPEKVDDAVLLAEYVTEENGPPPEAVRWARWLREQILDAEADYHDE